MAILKEQIYRTKFAKPEIFEWYSKKGITSIFVYSPTVLKNGNLCYFDEKNKNVRAIMNKGQTFVPISFFADFLGLGVEETDETVKVCSESACFTAKKGKSNCFVYSNGTTYLPAIEVAKALGISCRALDDDKLTVFAEKEILDEIERDVELQVSASYATLGKYDASKFTKEDFEIVKNKWRRVLVGSPEINDASDPDMQEKLNNIASAAQSTWDSMHKEDGRVILFGSEAPVE